MPRWHLRSRLINSAVEAPDQHSAWDTLRERPYDDFGLIVTAESDEVGDLIPVRTSTLMFRWHRDAEALAFIEKAVGEGLPDTTGSDLALAGRQ